MTRVSLEDVAKACGVSQMTVSRALRGLPKIRPERAAEIREMARKMGYRQDPFVTQLLSSARYSQHRKYRETIAFIWTGPGKHSWAEFAGVQNQAEKYGFKVEEFDPTREGLSGRRLSEVLKARGIRGVVLAPNAGRSTPHFWLAWDQFSCVLLGSSLRNRGIFRVQSDHFHSSILVVRALKRQGYRRPGLVANPSFYERTDRSLGAALAAFSESPVNLRKCLWLKADTDEASSFSKWYRDYKPDVLLAHNVGTARWLENLGLQIPGEVAVVVLGMTDRNSRWSGIYHNGVAIGIEAMKALVLKMQNRETGKILNPPVINITGEWMPGRTLPRVRATS